MHIFEIKNSLETIKEYDAGKYLEDEDLPEKFCIIQSLIYEGDYYYRCERCKFNFTTGGPLPLGHCNRPWMCV